MWTSPSQGSPWRFRFCSDGRRSGRCAPRPWGPFATAPLVGMTFLIAGYYGQGSFKEILEALLILALAIHLTFPTPTRRLLRWVPVALLLAGTLSVYAHAGLPWPLLFLAIWFVGTTVRRFAATRSVRAVVTRARAEIVPLIVGLGVLLVVLIPQLPRIARFVSDNVGTNGTGIPTDSLGNLARRLPLWEAFGIWDSPDYRVAGQSAFEGWWTAFVIVLVLFGAVWSFRRGEWMLPSAAAGTLLIWWATDHTQSPYVAAKALVLLAPLLMLVAVRPLVERDPGIRWMPSWWWLAAPILAGVLVVQVVGSSWDALTYSKVGPTDHAREIASLRPMLAGRPTLYLGNDDFTRWIFGDVPVQSPVISFPSMPMRPEKPWEYGLNYDVRLARQRHPEPIRLGGRSP